MPVMDGLEVCKQVRKMSDLPIIMLTAKDEDDDRILGLEIGADDYITKPFNSREVVARIKRFCDVLEPRKTGRPFAGRI